MSRFGDVEQYARYVAFSNLMFTGVFVSVSGYFDPIRLSDVIDSVVKK